MDDGCFVRGLFRCGKALLPHVALMQASFWRGGVDGFDGLVTVPLAFCKFEEFM